jgi:tripartite-type tricarboxylate transporter receptor subunit TctC
MPTPTPPPPAPAPQSAADFYKDKTVTLIVGFSPGGGFDYIARTFASYWPDYAGGPMVVKNMKGGAGLVAQNFVYKAKPDGLTIGTSNETYLLTPTIAEQPGVEYDIDKYNWIGWYVGSPPHVFGVSTKLRHTSMADLQKAKGLQFGAQLPTDTLAWAEAIIAEAFQLQDFEIVTGWTGMMDAALAAGKGELDGVLNNSASYREYMDRGFVKEPFVTLAYERDMEYFPNTPAITELVELTPELKNLMDAYLGARGSGKTYFTSPGVPEDRVKFMSETFAKIYEDKGARKQLGLRYDVLYPGIKGEEIAGNLARTIEIQKEYLPAFDELVAKFTK